MRYLPLLLLLSLPVAHAEPLAVQPTSINPAESRIYTLDAAMWARPRTGESVSSMPPLRDAVQTMLNNPGSKLALRYPGGDAGTLWVNELHDWLVALGIEPGMMVLQPGSAFEDRIELTVIVR